MSLFDLNAAMHYLHKFVKNICKTVEEATTQDRPMDHCVFKAQKLFLFSFFYYYDYYFYVIKMKRGKL